MLALTSKPHAAVPTKPEIWTHLLCNTQQKQYHLSQKLLKILIDNSLVPRTTSDEPPSHAEVASLIKARIVEFPPFIHKKYTDDESTTVQYLTHLAFLEWIDINARGQKRRFSELTAPGSEEPQPVTGDVIYDGYIDICCPKPNCFVKRRVTVSLYMHPKEVMVTVNGQRAIRTSSLDFEGFCRGLRGMVGYDRQRDTLVWSIPGVRNPNEGTYGRFGVWVEKRVDPTFFKVLDRSAWIEAMKHMQRVPKPGTKRFDTESAAEIEFWVFAP
ncbi:hypothetical protein BO71DRAFT_402851 [Aspergillus ellipticus CBS 707.79]|uniref:Uncharacterized protein n=1 Tax=Aspergillus ellipticus CBS 707.79 TaxID=1448320 RepID=A0A319DF59_9EURO|nr:hypothetical protein BO71DRAFT_402851 [Aspergillus ellipticus CBS 707.79]